MVVGYGNLNQVVVDTDGGHASVCVELDADPVLVATQVGELLERGHRAAP